VCQTFIFKFPFQMHFYHYIFFYFYCFVCFIRLKCPQFYEKATYLALLYLDHVVVKYARFCENVVTTSIN